MLVIDLACRDAIYRVSRFNTYTSTISMNNVPRLEQYLLSYPILTAEDAINRVSTSSGKTNLLKYTLINRQYYWSVLKKGAFNSS